MLQYNGGHPRLTVTSVGQSKAGDGGGIGLQSMADRAASIGCRLTTASEGDAWVLTVAGE